MFKQMRENSASGSTQFFFESIYGLGECMDWIFLDEYENVVEDEERGRYKIKIGKTEIYINYWEDIIHGHSTSKNPNSKNTVELDMGDMYVLQVNVEENNVERIVMHNSEYRFTFYQHGIYIDTNPRLPREPVLKLDVDEEIVGKLFKKNNTYYLTTDDNLYQLPKLKVLQDKCKRATKQADILYVKIIYTGKKMGKNGFEYHNHELHIGEIVQSKKLSQNSLFNF